MSSVVIVAAARTAIGTGRKGALVDVSAETMAAAALGGAVERSGFAPDEIDDIVMAESLWGGGDVARYAAVTLGMIHTPGMAVNRHCAGSLTAVGVASGAILAGMEKVIVAGGVNSASLMPSLLQRDVKTGEMVAWAPPTHPNTPDAPNRDMSITVGWNAAKGAGLTREELDAWAYRSHMRAVAAIDAGHFVDEIVPLKVRNAEGAEVEFKVDEHPKRNSTLEKLATLKPLHPEIEGFNITAGNAGGVNDAAAAMVLADAETAKAKGAATLARVVGWTSVGVEPARSGLSIAPVVEKLLARTGRRKEDIALWEINEAFASVPLAACRMLGLDEETVNISGSGCSLGHPIGATGSRMIMTLAADLRRRGGGLGIATMCVGGGMGGALMIEV